MTDKSNFSSRAPVSPDSLQSQIDDLQHRLSHQEYLLDQLNEVITRQDADIAALQQVVEAQKNRLDQYAFAQHEAGQEIIDQKPPHY